MLKLYKDKLKQDKINNAKIEVTPEELANEGSHKLSFNERQNYKFQMRYKRRYHFNEIFNRLFCKEANKPDDSEIVEIGSKVTGDFTKDNIYHVCSYNQRKHLIYIWVKLNGLEVPMITPEIVTQKDTIWCHLCYFYNTVKQPKAFKYRLVIDVICERCGWFEIRRLLYFKDNVKQRELVQSSFESLE